MVTTEGEARPAGMPTLVSKRWWPNTAGLSEVPRPARNTADGGCRRTARASVRTEGRSASRRRESTCGCSWISPIVRCPFMLHHFSGRSPSSLRRRRDGEGSGERRGGDIMAVGGGGGGGPGGGGGERRAGG